MGKLQDILQNMGKDKSEFKEQLKQAQMEDKIQRTIEERKMSSNERDLLKRMKQKREEGIKEQLDSIRKQENKENWKSKNLILGHGATILKNDRPILKEKNIFMDKKNDIPFKNKKRLFNGW